MQFANDHPTEYMQRQRRQAIFKRRRREMWIVVSCFCVGFIIGILLNYV
jgi:hypothetical protein